MLARRGIDAAHERPDGAAHARAGEVGDEQVGVGCMLGGFADGELVEVNATDRGRTVWVCRCPATTQWLRSTIRSPDPPRSGSHRKRRGSNDEGRADAASSPARGGVSASALSVVQCRETAVDRDATRPSTFALCDESSILTAGWALCATIRSSLRCRSAALRGPHTGPTRYLTHLQASRTQFDRAAFLRAEASTSAHTPPSARDTVLLPDWEAQVHARARRHRR